MNGWATVVRGGDRAVAVGAAAVMLAMCLGCRSPQPLPPAVPDPEVRRLAGAARRVWELGDAEAAARLYREALARARALDEPAAIAGTAGSLAVCLYELGNAAAAAPLVREAIVAAGRAGRVEPDLMVLDGRVRLGVGDLDGAARAAEAALRAAQPGTEGRTAARLLAAQIAIAQSNIAVAAESLAAARRELPQSASAPLRAWAEEVAAAERELAGDPAGGGRAWLEAAHWRGRASQPARVARALVAAMRAFERAGEPLAAADAALRAARALAATRPAEARALLERAGDLIADRDADGLREQLRALQRELAGPTHGP
ncbi:MAG: hypothetical protein N2652_05075 [Kiritimatiellae bacterium]|nr:hypothetical protein [Kiritimatiellia bacterium]